MKWISNTKVDSATLFSSTMVIPASVGEVALVNNTKEGKQIRGLFLQSGYRVARSKCRVTEKMHEKTLKVGIYTCSEGKIFCQSRIPFEEKSQTQKHTKVYDYEAGKDLLVTQ